MTRKSVLNNSAYNYALKLLARREHSVLELQQKLAQYQDDEDIAQAIDKLQAQKYQSDTRFAYEFVRMRFSQGKGKILIQMQLRQKGIESFDFSEFDFFTLAKQVRLRKYGEEMPSDVKKKVKQQRFLQGRGFGFDEIRYAFEST
jgi:regulatory protein